MFAFYWRVVIRPNAGPAALVATLMLASAAFQMVTIGLSVPLLEAAKSEGGASQSWVLDFFRSVLVRLGVAVTGPNVIFAVLAFASLLFVASSGFTLIQQYLTAATAEKLRRDTKSRIFESLLLGQYEVVAARGRGVVMQDLTAAPGAIYSAIIRLSMLAAAIFSSLALFSLMLYLSWWATLLIGALGLGAIYGTRRLVDSRARKAGTACYELQGRESAIATDAVDGLKVVKAHGLEHKISARYLGLLEAEVRPSLRVAFFRYLPAFINEFAAIVIVLILGALILLRPSSGMSFPALIAFLVAIRQCGTSIASINSYMVDLQTIRSSVEVVPEVLRQIPREKSGSRTLPRVSEVRFVDVSLQYQSRDEVLHHINLTMKRGTITAVVGATGAGKSSVANLLVGLYRPTSGKILADGIDLEEVDLSAWRKKIGYVSQDTFLFNATIRENISLWNESFSDSQVESAAKLAQLHDFVAGLPEGYDTPVGDRGLRLSGGQCQRIAIARAVLMKPAMLVLDEATSALDNLTEKAVYAAMSALRSDAIVLAVAHRLSTIRDADQIVVLESGHIVEAGTHTALIQEGGSYSRLYESESVHG
jgi:subfamily B ATP-binding cassette protein MsbA